ncbi:MAG: rhodanese-like domain-containing protein [Bacteriovoracaceae bacterium]|nr:rhodanese-like domain-containing protein [Bacteriovoracaceae bacterium]
MTHLKILFPALVLIFLSVASMAQQSRQAESFNVKEHSITVHEAYQLIMQNTESDDFIILDVRTVDEYAKSHIKNSTNFDFYNEDFLMFLDRLERGYTYLIYCRSGKRSLNTLKIMHEMGFENTFNMLGGISEWIKHEYPLTKSSVDPSQIN